MASHTNPYASPETPPGSAGFDPERTLYASFPRTWKVRSKMALATPNKWYRKAGWSFLLAPAFIYGLHYAPPVSFLNPREQAVFCWLLGLLIPLIVVVIAEQVGWWFNLQRHCEDPILGAAGEWQVIIDKSTITLQTPGGSRDWPLAQARLEGYDKSLVLAVDQLTALYVPAKANFGDETFAIWKETAVTRWIQAWHNQQVSASAPD